MKVTVVGTSCTWFKRKNTSFLIDDDIVFDVPEGAYKDIINLTDLFKIKHVIISHMHTDHALDLHIILTRFMRECKNKEPLKVYAPKGSFDRILETNKLFYSSEDEYTKEFYDGKVEFVDLEDGMNIQMGEYNVTAYKVEHGRPESYGFTFTNKKGTTVGFSGDTKVCENLHKLIDKSNFAFVEFASVEPHRSHICIRDFEELLKKYKNTKIYPVHTSDKTQDYSIANKFNYLEDGQVLEF